MTFTQSITTCFSKYVDFTGRASRSEYWFFALFAFVGSFVLGFVDGLAFTELSWQPLASIFTLAIFLPNIAVGARRLHDKNRSGWWQLLGIIPVIGVIVLIILFASKGEFFPNRFGANPLRTAATTEPVTSSGPTTGE